VIDSWSKIPEGILSGHVNSMGDWNECVGIRSPPSVETTPFQGKYCFTYLFPVQPDDDEESSTASPDDTGDKFNAKQRDIQSRLWKAASPLQFLVRIE